MTKRPKRPKQLEARIVATYADSVATCPDCSSEVALIDHGNKVMTVQVKHSPTCPAWDDPERCEIVVTMLPKSAVQS